MLPHRCDGVSEREAAAGESLTHDRKALHTRQESLTHTTEKPYTHDRKALHTRQKSLTHTTEKPYTAGDRPEPSSADPAPISARLKILPSWPGLFQRRPWRFHLLGVLFWAFLALLDRSEVRSPWLALEKTRPKKGDLVEFCSPNGVMGVPSARRRSAGGGSEGQAGAIVR